jgi:hypothetical protein
VKLMREVAAIAPLDAPARRSRAFAPRLPGSHGEGSGCGWGLACSCRRPPPALIVFLNAWSLQNGCDTLLVGVGWFPRYSMLGAETRLSLAAAAIEGALFTVGEAVLRTKRGSQCAIRSGDPTRTRICIYFAGRVPTLSTPYRRSFGTWALGPEAPRVIWTGCGLRIALCSQSRASRIYAHVTMLALETITGARALHTGNTKCPQCWGSGRVPMHHGPQGQGMPAVRWSRLDQGDAGPVGLNSQSRCGDILGQSMPMPGLPARSPPIKLTRI